ncbi:MAG: hypothetical protein II030_05110, partial [Treponema sp.]|nr:hypothetical protein [Treponema sp.]
VLQYYRNNASLSTCQGAFLRIFFVLAIKPSPDWNGTRSVFRPQGGMEAKAGTMKSGIKCLPWHFIPQVFWRKLACFFC